MLILNTNRKPVNIFVKYEFDSVSHRLLFQYSLFNYKKIKFILAKFLIFYK